MSVGAGGVLERVESGRPSASARVRVESLTLAAIVLAALVLRLPYLQTIPAFSDELDEVTRGLDILRGEDLPLTNVTTYIGALFNYLVALAFAIFGPHVIVPRALVMVGGVATVGATYLLGRQAAGPIAGAVAAGLLATSGTHILVNSHIALSSSLTPLPVALGVWLVGRAVLLPSGASLAWAGLALGLALQTHPTVIAVLAGCGLFLLLRAPRLLFSRWGAWAALAFLLGYANMALYNLATGFESISSALEASEDYQEGRDDEPPGYAAALGTLLLATMRLLGGAIGRSLGVETIVLNPAIAIYSLLAVGGLALAARRGLGLWPLVVAIWLLLLPLFNWKYGNIVLSRWINPIAPLCYAGVGLTLAALWSRLSAGGAIRPLRYLAPLLAAWLVLQPLAPLQRHYERTARNGPTNDEPLRQAALLETSRRSDERVVIDASLQNYGLENGGSVSKAIRYALTVRQVPLVRLAVTEERLSDALGPAPSILLATDRRKADGLRASFQVTPLEASAGLPDPPLYAVYRVSRR